MPVLLIRHAQSVNNSLPEEQRSDDPGLTEVGHEQSRRLAARLQRWQPERLLTSAFRRTLETTAAVATATGLRPEVVVDLHEQGGCQAGASPEVYEGRPGLTGDEIVSQFGDWVVPDSIDEEGWWKCRRWERPLEAEERARRVAADMVGQFGDLQMKVAVITHGMFKPILVSALLGRPFIGNEWLGDLNNTSVTQLSLSAAGVTLESYNDTSHLVGEAGGEGCGELLTS
jgi:broad specificity phosphatase PhoE